MPSSQQKVISLFHLYSLIYSCIGTHTPKTKQIQLKPVNSTEYTRRSSRSGSLVNTPDHQLKSSTIPTSAFFSLNDVGESSNYLEAKNDSSASNSTCSFDAPPDVLPPVPPRLTNPPPSRHNRIASSEHLIIIDTDDQVDTVPVPAVRTKIKSTQPPPPPMTNNTVTKPSAMDNRIGFENNFVQTTNTLNLKKSNVVANRVSLIEPPPKPPPPSTQNHKLNMTNETKTSEVCRISSHIFISFVHFQKQNNSLAFFFLSIKFYFPAFCVSM